MVKKIIVGTSNYFDDELKDYRDKINAKYELKSDGNAYIETEDSLGDVVEFFIYNVYPQIVVNNDKDLGLCITIYDGYLE